MNSKRKFMILMIAVFSMANAQFQIEPSIRHDIGSILYHITFPADSGSSALADDVKLAGESELDYPADVLVPGLCLRYLFNHRLISSVEILGAASVTQPGLRKMKDSDWITVSTSSGSKFSSSKAYSSFKFSYTESKNTLQYVQGGIGINFVSPAKHKNWKFGLYYDVEYFYNEVFGITGWQYVLSDSADTTTPVTDLPKVHFDTLHDTKVNTYEALLHTMRIKAEWTFLQRNGVTAALSTMFAPIAIGSDEDYHLLRGKKSNAHTYGVDFEPRLLIMKQFRPKVSGTFALSGRYFWTKGEMTQTYYESGHEADAGDQFKGIETNIILYRTFLSLFLTYEL
jgi:hypothetical protein